MSEADKKIEALYDFPCEIRFKIIAHRKPDIEKTVKAILSAEGIDTENLELQIRPSKTNKYWAITVPLYFSSKAELDAVHQALNAHEHVIMTL